jgi:hypothetical protein
MPEPTQMLTMIASESRFAIMTAPPFFMNDE